MSFLGKAKKQDLFKLCEELGLDVTSELKIIDLRNLIVKAPDYEEDFAKSLLGNIVEARLEEEARNRVLEEERISREREEIEHARKLEEEKIAYERQMLEVEKERAFELEKIKLSSTTNGNDSHSASHTQKSSARELHTLLPNYDPNSSDISLYLLMFERQASKSKVEEKDWVSHLMAKLPLEITEIILREPEKELDNYKYIKQVLLKRYKLNPEAFRTKFVQHQRRNGSLWRDFAFELRNYLEEWLVGLEITNFESLKDLMLTDQIKRRVPSDIRNHFLDEWGKVASSSELTEKLDEYELVRRSEKKPSGFIKVNERKKWEPNTPSLIKGNIREERLANRVESRDTNPRIRNGVNSDRSWREDNFEQRRPPRCYQCHLVGHLRPNCPLLKRKNPPEAVNNLECNQSNFGNNMLAPYMSTAMINGKIRNVLRDSGSSIDIASRNYITDQMLLGETVWVKQPLDEHCICLPLARIEIEGNFGKITTKAAIINSNLDSGYYILGNRTADLIARNTNAPEKICAVVTRAQSRLLERVERPKEGEVESSRCQERGDSVDDVTAGVDRRRGVGTADQGESVESGGGESPLSTAEETLGSDLFFFPSQEGSDSLLKIDSAEMRKAQEDCLSLQMIREVAKESSQGQHGEEFIFKEGLLFRNSTDHLGNKKLQLVIPLRFREEIKSLCHEGSNAHLGVTKTKDRLLRYFFWPGCFKDIDRHVQTCDPCQRVGKAGEKKKAPMKIVPVITEIFSRLNIDVTGPLPMTPSGKRYLLTVICMSSKYPDAIPVADISSVTVTDALLNIFSRTGFPREIQSDLATSFTSNLTSEFFDKFGIKVVHSSVCHPQSNPVERFHLTIKRLLKVLCLEAGMDWEKHLPAALLALRTVVHESTGFSPAELVHGKNLRTPETLLYEHWVEPKSENLSVTEYVFGLINRLKRCQELAIERMEELQGKRKLWYDKKAVKRQFKKGDSVLVLATAKPHKFAVQWVGPGVIEGQLSDTNYTVRIPGKRDRSTIYHVNMLKPYHKRPEAVNLLVEEEVDETGIEEELEFPYLDSDPNIYDFEDVMQRSNLNANLNAKQIAELQAVLNKYAGTFSNDPGMTELVTHDIELISNQPVRAKPYRTSPRRNAILKAEIQRMLDQKIIEEGESDYTSPMILVEAPNKDPRPCVDYRNLNALIRTEFFPLPNIEERVEKVASAKYISLLDLAKGYWQIPLSPRAQKLAAFVTSFGTYRPLRMAFGLKNAPFFFSKLMARILKGCDEFAVPYLDDVAIFSDEWESHLTHLECVLKKISQAKLTIKPSKCKFAQNHVKYLGHMVGNGFRTPAEAKVQTIIDFPTPATKTQLRAFLGLTGYYGHYIPRYSIIAAPLTNALMGSARKGKIAWSQECEDAFRELKRQLTGENVLYAPNYEREFLVQTDASDIGMGVVLTQRNEKNEEHPVLYLSKKFSAVERKYCTTEKECASIVFAIKKLHHYLDGQKFTIITDHNPLVWLQKNASSNARLMRWSLALQPYNFTIIHRSGKENKNADCLSRVESE